MRDMVEKDADAGAGTIHSHSNITAKENASEQGMNLTPLVFLFIALGSAVGQVIFWGTPIIESLLVSLLVVTVGLQGIWAFLGHYFKSDEIALFIGWPPGNPFQKEMAFANLAFGVLGILSFWFRGGFWIATVIGISVLLLGAASIHLNEIRESQNLNPGNAGIILLTDIIVPLALIVLLIHNIG